jgi:hypothetical protein
MFFRLLPESLEEILALKAVSKKYFHRPNAGARLFRQGDIRDDQRKPGDAF